jgi:hypothetical protein
VYYGSAAGLSATANWTAESNQASAQFGQSAGTAGDVNGDGYADFLVTGTGPGGVYLYFGSPRPDAAIWNAPPYALRARIASPPVSVAGAGDVNGDGYADFLIVPGGATVDFEPPPPRLYLGSATALGAAWNAASTSQRIDVITREVGADSLGDESVGAVTGVGDVNGDGYSDFVLSFPPAGTSPATFLFLGSATPQTDDLSKPSPGKRIELVAPDTGSDYFGSSVSGAGDIDGDGHGDVLISVPGTVHVYLGAAAPTPGTWNTATSAQRIDLSIPGDPVLGSFGIGVAGVGDVDGDGHADFLIGGRMGGLWLELGTATPSAAVWIGASASRRIDLTPITSL